MGMPIPDLANLPGVSRPGGGGGPSGPSVDQIANQYSFKFDSASSSYFSIDSSGTLNTFHQNPFSISFWFKTSSGSIQVLADKSTTSSGATRAFYIYMQSGVIYWYGSTGPGGTITNGTYSDGNWHHVVCVAESDTVAKIYVDGVDDTNDNAKDRIGGLTITAPILLGKHHSNNSFFLNGSMDEFAVFNRALDSGDVQTIYNATTSGQTADLNTLSTGAPLAWYRMGD